MKKRVGVPPQQKNDTPRAITKQMFGKGGKIAGAAMGPSSNGTLAAPGKLKRRGK